jgi:hypothetical protein
VASPLQIKITERALKEFGDSVVAYMPVAVGKSAGQAVEVAGHHISQVAAKGIQGNVFTRTELKAAHVAIAERAQNAIVQGWRARLPLKSGPYRKGSNPQKDRLSGRLGEALASEAMISGTTDRGISFLNTEVLRDKARHWYRVNYGAFGDKVPAIRQPKSYPVDLGGHTIGTVQDPNEPASQSYLPIRFTYSQANEFVPLRGPARPPDGKRGGGHRAALFTDLGWKAMADGVEPAYRKMLFTKFSRGGMADRFNKKEVDVKVQLKPKG